MSAPLRITVCHSPCRLPPATARRLSTIAAIKKGVRGGREQATARGQEARGGGDFSRESRRPAGHDGKWERDERRPLVSRPLALARDGVLSRSSHGALGAATRRDRAPEPRSTLDDHPERGSTVGGYRRRDESNVAASTGRSERNSRLGDAALEVAPMIRRHWGDPLSEPSITDSYLPSTITEKIYCVRDMMVRLRAMEQKGRDTAHEVREIKSTLKHVEDRARGKAPWAGDGVADKVRLMHKVLGEDQLFIEGPVENPTASVIMFNAKRRFELVLAGAVRGADTKSANRRDTDSTSPKDYVEDRQGRRFESPESVARSWAERVLETPSSAANEAMRPALDKATSPADDTIDASHTARRIHELLSKMQTPANKRIVSRLQKRELNTLLNTINADIASDRSRAIVAGLRKRLHSEGLFVQSDDLDRTKKTVLAERSTGMLFLAPKLESSEGPEPPQDLERGSDTAKVLQAVDVPEEPTGLQLNPGRVVSIIENHLSAIDDAKAGSGVDTSGPIEELRSLKRNINMNIQSKWSRTIVRGLRQRLGDSIFFVEGKKPDPGTTCLFMNADTDGHLGLVLPGSQSDAPPATPVNSATPPRTQGLEAASMAKPRIAAASEMPVTAHAPAPAPSSYYSNNTPKAKASSNANGAFEAPVAAPAVSSNSRLEQASKPVTEDAETDDSDIPVAIPYTTSASQFLYGYNVVLAALRAKRRKLYHMYVSNRSPRGSESDDVSRGKRPVDLTTLARAADVPWTNTSNTKMLDQMSDQRPHNGIVLEASKLPAPPVLSLGRPDRRTAIIPLKLLRQSAEDVAVNGAPAAIQSEVETWRHPFVVLLDGITDPGNVGNIIRTCHFYGVDAVAIATNTCANLSSSVLAKASSGACEAVQILALPQPSGFVYDSAREGWKIFAAVAPTAGPAIRSVRDVSRQTTTANIAMASPLAQYPCILMLGAEGEGLRENLRNRADVSVSIEGGQRRSDMPDVGVDSVNVTVATGVLLDAFLRKPIAAPARKNAIGELGW